MVASKNIESRLVFAQKIAKSLSSYQMEVSQSNLACERKSDGTPVTEVDQESERRFRLAVAEAFPDDDVLGEEEGQASANAPGRWVIDPIDGTRKFMHGLPFWGICLGFEWEGTVEMGVIAIPGAGLIYSAMKGKGAECNGKRIRAKSDKIAPERTILTMPSRPYFASEGWAPAFDETQTWIEHDPGFLDAYSYGMVADGRLDGLLSCGDKWWDIAAAVCLVREAGGQFTNLKGEEPQEGHLNLAASPATAEWLLPRLQSLGL